MRLIRLIPILLFSFLFAAEPISSIPAVHRNLGTDEQGLYMRRDGRKIYARPANDKFEFTDMYGHPRGSAKGLDLDFRNRDLNGILYYGFINYKDGSHPLPVYFKRYSRIESGKAFINIADHLSGKYDMIGWQKRGYGSLGYRIINEKGDFIYDGKVSFEFKNNRFEAVPTLIEGPFADLITHESAVISFETTRPQRTEVRINGKIYRETEASTHHEIQIKGLSPETDYRYSVIYGTFSQHYSLSTAPRPGSRTAFTFAYASDSRSGRGGGERDIYGSNAYIMKRIGALAVRENAVFLQFTGDLINGYQTSYHRMQLQYANWKHAVEPFAHSLPIYEGFGNHESYCFIFYDEVEKRNYYINKFPYDSDSGEKLFADNFVNPRNGHFSEDGSRYDPDPGRKNFPDYSENAYWYRYDNIAMVVLNSNYWYAPLGQDHLGGNKHSFIMDMQMEWLKDVLGRLEADKAIDHVFISLHTPVFPNGGHVNADMWFNGVNVPGPRVGNRIYKKGAIECRDQLLDLVVNQFDKPLAFLTGDEHNFSFLPIDNSMPRYPENYIPQKVDLKRKLYQLNNGAAGAPYYAIEATPWMDRLRDFSTQNALIFFDIDGNSVTARVINPDTLEKIAAYRLR